MVFEGSRYEGAQIYYDIDNEISYIAPISTYMKSDDSDYVYQVKQGDRLDLLAKQFYGNPQKKWLILFANPQYITELDIKVGDIITIPNPERLI